MLLGPRGGSWIRGFRRDGANASASVAAANVPVDACVVGGCEFLHGHAAEFVGALCNRTTCTARMRFLLPSDNLRSAISMFGLLRRLRPIDVDLRPPARAEARGPERVRAESTVAASRATLSGACTEHARIDGRLSWANG